MSEVRGLSSTEIGALLGVTQIARLAAGPTVGLIADLTRAPRTLAIVLAVLCTLAYSGMLLPVQIPLLVALACLAVSLSSAAVALGESVAVTTIANEDYGRVRLWGSLAFVAANVIGGRILSGTGAAQVMPMLICSSGMLIFASLGLPRRCKAAEEDLRGPNYPAASRADTLSEARSLVTSPVFLLFLLASCSIQSAHATYYSFSTIMLQGAGHTGSAIGMVWAAGVAAEVSASLPCFLPPQTAKASPPGRNSPTRLAP